MQLYENNPSQIDLKLSQEEKNAFREEFMIAMYKQLHANGHLSEEQLIELLKMHNR